MTDLPTPPPEQPEGTPYDPTSAYGPTDTVVVAPARGGKRGIVIGAVAAVLAVIAGVAVYAATQLSGGGMQPDELVPKSAFAFTKVDLDPAAGQKLAAHAFFEHFPNLKGKTGSDGENPFEHVLETLITDQDVNYKTDVAPWFDRRAAAAAYLDAKGKPVGLTVLRSKDDAKARTSLDAMNAKAKANGDDELAYEITRGYVVISDTKAHVDDVIAKSSEASLRDNDAYRKDVDALSGDQVAVAWADIQQAYRAITADSPEAGLIPTAITDRIKGRIVAGVHFSGDYAELEGKAFDLDQRFLPTAGDATQLAKLPASTLAALSVSGLGKSVNDTLSLTGMDPDALAETFLSGTGLSVTDDVLPLLGDQLTLALGSFGFEPGELKAGLLSRVADPEKAKAAGAKLAAIAQQLGVPVKAVVKGNTFVLATPGDYADTLANGSGGLTTSPKFTKAIGDLGKPAAVLYVDLQRLIDAEPNTPESAFRSFGVVSGYDGGVGFFRARLVVG